METKKSIIKIYLASKNQGKINEIKTMIPNDKLNLVGLGLLNPIPTWVETGETFYENALIKANAVRAFASLGVLAEDSGLVVEDLNGEPGIYSKRYAGQNSNNIKNISKVLEKLSALPQSNRYAYFITCFVFIDIKGDIYHYESRCYGTIAKKMMGENGFGYDPIFIPKGESLTFAQLGLKKKNTMSHRCQAFKLFLKDQNFLN